MDVEFMLSDSLEVSKPCVLKVWSMMSFLQAVRSKLVVYKTIEEAAVAVDEMFNLAFLSSGSGSYFPEYIFGYVFMIFFAVAPGEDSGEDSGDEGERPAEEEDEEADGSAPESPVSSLLR